MTNTRFPNSLLSAAVDALHAEIRMLQQVADHELATGNLDAAAVSMCDAGNLLQLCTELQALQFQGSPSGQFLIVAA